MRQSFVFKSVPGLNPTNGKLNITGTIIDDNISLKGPKEYRDLAFQLYIKLNLCKLKGYNFKILYEIGSGIIILKHKILKYNSFIYINFNKDGTKTN